MTFVRSSPYTVSVILSKFKYEKKWSDWSSPPYDSGTCGEKEIFEGKRVDLRLSCLTSKTSLFSDLSIGGKLQLVDPLSPGS